MKFRWGIISVIVVIGVVVAGLAWFVLKEPGKLKEIQRLTYRPDDKGNLVLKNEFTIVHEYDSDGKRTLTEYYTNGKLSSKNIPCQTPDKVTKTYDGDNRLKSINYLKPEPPYSFKTEHFNKDGEIVNISASIKDSKGNVVKKFYWNGNKKLLSKIIRKYDTKGNLTDYLNYSNSGQLRERRKLDYCSAGNKIKEIDYKKDGSVGLVFDQLNNKSGKVILKRCIGGTPEYTLFSCFTYKGRKVIEKQYWCNNKSPLNKEMINWLEKNEKQIGEAVSVYDTKGRRIERCDYRLKDDGSKSITGKFITNYRYYWF